MFHSIRNLLLHADTVKVMVYCGFVKPTFSVCISIELLLRTNGRKGERLRRSTTSNVCTQNMSVPGNDTSYRYEEGKNDELGFKNVQ